jgi:hypothetical protein
MAETTLFTIGARASCTDGVCGKLRRVVIDPVARAVTHLVVDRDGVGRLVPLDLVDTSTGEIQLCCTMAEFEQLDSAEKTQPFYGQAGPRLLEGTRYAPAITYDDLPPGEIAVRPDKHVHATDGDIGQVRGLAIDPGNQHVTYVLLQEGHLRGRKEVAIPVSAVTRIDGDGIWLNLTKQQVQDLPPVDIDHPAG